MCEHCCQRTWTAHADAAITCAVVRTLIYKLKTSKKVKEALGDDVKPIPFILSKLSPLGSDPYRELMIAVLSDSDPWINGSVNLLQGSVDVSFPIQGSKGSGTAMFTSIRRSADARFEIRRSMSCSSAVHP